MTNRDSIFQSRDITLPTKVRLVKAMFFPVAIMDVRVGLWRKLSTEELMLWSVVLEKTLQSPLECREIQPVHSKDQPWDFFGRTDAKAETPILWPHHVKSWLIGKDPDTGRDSGQEEKGTTEDEMAGWHYRLDRHEFEWTPEVGDEQGGLVCCSPCGHKESRHNWATELNWTESLSSNSPNLHINLVMIKYNITTFLLCAVSEMVITAMLSAGHTSENFTCTDILNSNHSFIM